MANPIASYSFLPWLRQGIANNISAADLDTSVKLRATIPVQLELTGDGLAAPVTQTITRNVQLFGPGDILGIESRAIIKTEPRHWITNFEPNYLPYIDFYDEDFLWRYTPAAPDPTRKRLRPWIALVVLKEDEFTDGANLPGKPLPIVTVPNTNAFPPAEQLWAWAHIHVNRSLTANDSEIVATDMAAVLPRFQATLNENADLAYARLICPRRLEENAAYHAFLVPVFESGRLAGLGLDPSKAPHATFSAWAAYPAGATKEEAQNFPYYYRWYFRTGSVGDFEYLVRLLEPKPVDKRVGTRDMDVQEPGANLPGITDAALGGVLKLGGALRVPPASLTPADQTEAEKYEQWAQPYPHEFQQALADFINLADDYGVNSTKVAHSRPDLAIEIPLPEESEDQNDPDPLITPPLYGRWHALTQRLLEDRDGNSLPNNNNWVHELNLDPRFRVSAGFGTKVVQERQEEYMNAAWEQIGQVLEANRRIRAAQLAKEVSEIWYDRHLLTLHAADPEKATTLTAPLHSRIIADGLTIAARMNSSVTPSTVVSTPLRRMVRPSGRLQRYLAKGKRPIKLDNLLARINEGAVQVAPPKGAPNGAVTVPKVGRAVSAQPNAPAGLRTWFKDHPDATLTLDELPKLPRMPNFVIIERNFDFRPKPGEKDSEDARRFKAGLAEISDLLTASAEAGATPTRDKLDFPKVSNLLFANLNPAFTIPRRTWLSVVLPNRIKTQIGEDFVEAMAYPEFDTPMYKPLVDISTELFLPNLNLIEQNSITLLETNQKFIEAYMVGLNHEFGRELLWREYLTDQRGSYFRQFWEVASFLSSTAIDPQALKEKLRDIPPLHRWSKASKLGDHDHREEGGAAEEEIVLVIRGELLKKYPTAVIYAHRADWQRKDGKIDNKQERRPVPLTATEEANPPRTKIKTPLYEAKIEPDIYFFGFDLTTSVAKGGTGENEGDDPGWFFVLKERPGEPRFGFDIQREGALNVWNDLAWSDVLPGGTPGNFIQINNATPSLNLIEPTSAEVTEKHDQWNEDRFVAWNRDTSSADLAYILYQAPVLVAIHASEMLRQR